MSQPYFFYDQAGIIPGVPGTFSRCRVDIDDEGQVITSPLVSVEAVEGSKPIEQVQATTVQEQENEPAPNTNNQES